MIISFLIFICIVVYDLVTGSPRLTWRCADKSICVCVVYQ